MNAVVKIAGIFSLAAALGSAQSLSGTWSARVTVSGLEIPFTIELTTTDSKAQATLFNGDERFPSTSGTFTNGALVVKWEYFAATLAATYKDGGLEGVYDRARSNPYSFHAVRKTAIGSTRSGPPQNIDGIWEVHDIGSLKGEQAWRLIVKQN